MKDRKPEDRKSFANKLMKRAEIIKVLAELNFGAEKVLADFAKNPLFGNLNEPLT